MTSDEPLLSTGSRNGGRGAPGVPLHWWAAADAVVMLVFCGALLGLTPSVASDPVVHRPAAPILRTPSGVLELSPVRVEAPAADTPGVAYNDELLESALERADELAPLSSLLVHQGGELIVERYYRGMRADRATNLKSVSKTLLSPLVAIAIDRGLIDGPEQPLADLLPGYFDRLESAGRLDRQKGALTLHHALSMTMGIESTSFGNYGAWVSSRDWVWDQLRRPVVCRPGCFEYSTGSTHLISAILTERSGRDLRSFAQEEFFGPLGIRLPPWDRDPQGRFLGGNNMALTPRQLLDVGLVFQNGGRWEGRQLFSESWIEQSWRPNGTSPWNGHRYGYLWWSDRWGGRTAHFAWGYGGQYLVLVPSLDLTVVVTSSLGRRQRGHTRRLRDFFDDYLIPAFSRAQ